ncbi:MAG: hypothetical protein RLZZ435_2914, partial [Cyanobacteriota bacterium]
KSAALRAALFRLKLVAQYSSIRQFIAQGIYSKDWLLILL